METRNAAIAKATFETLLASLGCTPMQAALKHYEELFAEEVAEHLLDLLEPLLKEVAAMYGCTYLRPELSHEGVRLLLNSQAQFVKVYAYTITHAYKQCLGGIMYI